MNLKELEEKLSTLEQQVEEALKSREQAQRLEETLKELSVQLSEAQDRAADYQEKAEKYDKALEHLNALFGLITPWPLPVAPASELVLRTERPDITVEVHKQRIVLDDTTIQGKIMLLYLDGYFIDKRKPGHVNNELIRRGYSANPRRVGEALVELVRLGLLQREGKEYWNAVDPKEAKIQRKEIEE